MKILILMLIPSFALAFTLNNSVGARFKKDVVKVRVASNTGTCATAGTTESELEDLIEPAIDEFWNTVPTSKLVLEKADAYSTTDGNFQTGELCLSGSACGGTPIPAVTNIVITCNTNATNFPGGSSLLALAMPNNIGGREIKGAVVLINDNSAGFGALSRDKKIAVLAHEIGHAIGLGHSKDKAALMYARVIPDREKLGHDDRDGVTYLYGEKMDMMGAGCFLGSLKDSDDNQGGPGPGGFLVTLVAGLAMALVLLRQKRSGVLRQPP